MLEKYHIYLLYCFTTDVLPHSSSEVDLLLLYETRGTCTLAASISSAQVLIILAHTPHSSMIQSDKES